MYLCRRIAVRVLTTFLIEVIVDLTIEQLLQHIVRSLTTVSPLTIEILSAATNSLCIVVQSQTMSVHCDPYL